MIKKLKEYFIRIGWLRILGVIIGNVVLGFGVSILKMAGMGNDPYTGMVMALADHMPLSYGTLLVVINTGLFLLELIWGRKYIGVGTVINWVLLGYIATFFINLETKWFGLPKSLLMQVALVVVGVVIVSFGLSVYQTADVGIAPYDSFALILSNKMPVKYFWCRLTVDLVCAGACALAGGIVGVGTLLSAVGLSPLIKFFDRHFSENALNHQVPKNEGK